MNDAFLFRLRVGAAIIGSITAIHVALWLGIPFPLLIDWFAPVVKGLSFGLYLLAVCGIFVLRHVFLRAQSAEDQRRRKILFVPFLLFFWGIATTLAFAILRDSDSTPLVWNHLATPVIFVGLQLTGVIGWVLVAIGEWIHLPVKSSYYTADAMRAARSGQQR